MSSNGEHRHQGSAAAQHQGALAFVLVLTSAYVLAEIAGGLLTGSLALIADAGHALTDVFGMGLALAAIWFARRPATSSRTYGFYRAEMLAALANGILPFAIAAYILYEAWRRLQSPSQVHSLPMLGVAIGGLIVNIIGVRLLYRGAGESLNLRGAFLEVLADLVAAVGVIVGALVILVTGWRVVDPLISVGIALFILPRAWRLLTGVIDVLLEATPKGISIAELEGAMDSVPGVTAVHEIHVWTITSGFVAMSAHVEANERASSELLHELQQLLRSGFGIEHATLQLERGDHSGDGVCCAIDPRCLVVGSIGRLVRADVSAPTEEGWPGPTSN